MLNILKAFRRHHRRSMQERRLHPRHDCLIKVYYLAQGSWYRGSIQNISEGGAYIRSIQKVQFSKGETILMVVELRVLRDQIRGRIIRAGSDGIGVAFHTSEPGYNEFQALLAAHCPF
jgi:PilZ domain